MILTVGLKTASILHITEDHEPAALVGGLFLPVSFLFSGPIPPLCSQLNPVLFFWPQTGSDNQPLPTNRCLPVHGPPPSDFGLGSFMLTVSSRWNTPVTDEPRTSGWGIRKTNKQTKLPSSVLPVCQYCGCLTRLCANAAARLPRCVSCTFPRDTILTLAHPHQHVLPSTARPLAVPCIPGTSHRHPL